MADTPYILSRADLDPFLRDPRLFDAISTAFVAFSSGRANVPPPAELIFREPPGEVHVKSGAIDGMPYYIVKIASSFYDNPAKGISSSQGAMLVFRRETGELHAVLLDGGSLTDVRTAVAGALCAKALARPRLKRIGVVGTGIQARLQPIYTAYVRECRDLLVWGRRAESVAAYTQAMEAEGFRVERAGHPDDLVRECDLIFTTTPSREPLLRGPLQPGTCVVAVGSDTPEKQELDTAIFETTDLVVVDSRSHCRERGDVSHAIREGRVRVREIVELGEILGGTSPGRRSEDDVIVADLTGIAVQDLQIASFMLDAFISPKK